ETQMKCFEEHPEVSVVGGQIVEFDGAETNITGRRRVPLRHEDIAAYMKSGNGLNFHNYPNLDILFEK
ncbi:MAG: glycosyl transferase, partial [Prevotella sp.]|nr:glycosyl transferase [Prevotella sp.]